MALGARGQAGFILVPRLGGEERRAIFFGNAQILCRIFTDKVRARIPGVRF
jgi:hypothetical protein